MKIGVPRELKLEERRVPLTPEGVSKLTEHGAEVVVEAGLGQKCAFSDEAYRQSGAAVENQRDVLLSESDIVLRVRQPPLDEVPILKPGVIHISFLDPFNEVALVKEMANEGVNAISLEMVPRLTRAQKMDALSSQANLAGYVAVILAAGHLDKILPMMTTPAGTIAPARVFVIGAGVAGLQAIATAKRLGARVEAFDTRPVVEEQVKSLGARFVKIDLGDTGETKGGYAKALTDEQLDLQRQAMARHCANSDVVVTTAQLFGKPAPRIITREMLGQMSPGSVVVDLAVESGGNVEASRPDEVVEVEGVRVIGYSNLPGRVPVNASQVYSNNVVAMILEYWDKTSQSLKLDLEDEIIQGCLITHQGEVCNPQIQQWLKKKED